VSAGFFTGGGQSLISLQKGIAADAILEVTIVLSTGEIITANACENPDIFCAVRGGGGSTFEIILSFKFKVSPSEHISGLQLAFQNPTLNQDIF
jgi:FAD/FMN-containing dehydrogenase